MGDEPNAGAAGRFHEYVRVYLAGNLIEAEFIKGLLLSNEIPAILEDEASETIGLGSSAFARGVPVLVPDSQADEARAIIDDRADRSGDEDEDEDEPTE